MPRASNGAYAKAISFRLRQELSDLARQSARDEGVSVNAILNRLIDRGLGAGKPWDKRLGTQELFEFSREVLTTAEGAAMANGTSKIDMDPDGYGLAIKAVIQALEILHQSVGLRNAENKP
jgi:hypothetical protein